MSADCPLWFDFIQLLEGRKPCGGKVEVKIRVREPFGQSQFRTAQEKWLVIDQFLA